MSKHIYSYLALGDSYTIGESIPIYENFPYQTVQLLRKKGFHFHAPEIIAQTGWTSFELAEYLLHTRLLESYDFVSLLIGVNNQYRELSVEEFETDFTFLLRKAIHLSGGHASHVFVLSIPDWGITPFAAKKNAKKISGEIDSFNAICKEVSKKNGVAFINITEESRKAEKDKSLLAKDQLHYSGKAYAVWADKTMASISAQLK